MSISKPANEEDAQEDAGAAMDPADTKPPQNGVESSVATIAGGEVPKQQQESSLAGADVSNKKLCGVCNEKEWKYKCTRCYLPS
jgi:zinc finger HIT domain-containing protein 3